MFNKSVQFGATAIKKHIAAKVSASEVISHALRQTANRIKPVKINDVLAPGLNYRNSNSSHYNVFGYGHRVMAGPKGPKSFFMTDPKPQYMGKRFDLTKKSHLDGDVE
jgi:hypothetical protein